ncbi:MAG: hypothetical protein Q9160_003712 [Pyrenula sp. 1 TL-2023]
MGNESSTPVDESVPPQTLETRTLAGIAKYIQEHDTGAGISTSAGIPDFRSPDTGLYANLARLNLPYAEAVFDISYFRHNPFPFYTLAHELYPGKYKPTVTHSFIRLLHDKGILMKLFTQNIDCLEREAGVPGEKIIEAHGSFATQHCIECRAEYPEDAMRKAVAEKEVPHCLRKGCDGLVKPDIVFFGEPLPETFHRNRALPEEADLALVMGTSLTVQPFASLPSFVKEQTPRILINLERVGGLGSRADDVLVLGDCDTGVRKLADELGWRDELEILWKKANPKARDRKQQALPPPTKDEKLEQEVDDLTKDIDNTLKISRGHTEWLNAHLTEKQFTIESHDETADGKAEDRLKPGIESSTKNGGSVGGLAHVYPHIDRKPSL